MKEKKSAIDSALFYLSFRNRTETEIIQYLSKKEYDSEEINVTVARLKELDYIDDYKFVENYIRSHYLNSTKSKKEILFKLLPFEINKDVVSEVLDSIDSCIEEENAVRFFEKQIRMKQLHSEDTLACEKLKQKAASHGFTYSTIAKAMKRIEWNE